MTEQLDSQGEAREALSAMVTDYSKRVLSEPRMLSNLVTDLLPDLPRERNLLVTAAESDVAGELTRHVEEHHLDPDTAVALVARSLTDRRALDPAASTWVTTEYAQALGYHLRSAGSPPAAAAPAPPPLEQHTVTTFGQYGSQPATVPPPAPPQPGTAPPQANLAPPQAYTAPPQAYTAPPQPGTAPPPWTAQPQAPAASSPGGYPGWAPPQVPPPGGGYPPAPMPWIPPTAAQKKRNRGPILAAAGVAVALVLYVAVAAAVHIAPFSPVKPKAAPSLSASPIGVRSALTPTASHTPGVASLTELLPGDINDPATQCGAHTPKFTLVGEVQGIKCDDPGLPNGLVEAYQMNSYASYLRTWQNFNKWWGFTSYTPGSACPPPGSDHLTAEGTTTWNDEYFPTRQGQVLECEWTGSGSTLNDPAFAWTMPTENTIFIAWGGPNTSFASLETWWEKNVVPLASPTPVAPTS